MVQGALLCPDLPGHIADGDGTPIRPGTSGTKAAADVPPGVSRYSGIAADLWARILSRKWERGAGLAACRTLAQW